LKTQPLSTRPHPPIWPCSGSSPVVPAILSRSGQPATTWWESSARSKELRAADTTPPPPPAASPKTTARGVELLAAAVQNADGAMQVRRVQLYGDQPALGDLGLHGAGGEDADAGTERYAFLDGLDVVEVHRQVDGGAIRRKISRPFGALKETSRLSPKPFPEALQFAAHGPEAPIVEKGPGPDRGFVPPEMSEGLLQIPGPGGGQLAGEQGMEFLPGSPAYPAASA